MQLASRDTGGARGWVSLRFQGGQGLTSKAAAFGVLGAGMPPGVSGAAAVSQLGLSSAVGSGEAGAWLSENEVSGALWTRAGAFGGTAGLLTKQLSGVLGTTLTT
jgi:hypothetical protein